MTYSKFKQYGKKFSEHYWGDYVHNIWLRYFDKHGVDLFQEEKSNRWIYAVVKNEFINSLYKSDLFVSIVKEIDDITGDDIELDIMETIVDDSSPSVLDNLIYNELDHFIKEKIKYSIISEKDNSNASKYKIKLQRTLDTYELLKLGYPLSYIAKELGLKENNGAVYYKNKIKLAIESMAVHNNPFNGSRIKVTRVVSEKTFKKKNYEPDYDLEDENEYYKLYVHKESGDGLLVNIDNPIGSGQYVKNLEDGK